MSSETRLPASITFFAARPSGVPALIAPRAACRRSRSAGSVGLRDEAGLGALAGARRAEKYQSHGCDRRADQPTAGDDPRVQPAPAACRRRLRDIGVRWRFCPQSAGRSIAQDQGFPRRTARARARGPRACPRRAPACPLVTATTMRKPCHSARNCSSASKRSIGAGGRRRKRAQEPARGRRRGRSGGRAAGPPARASRPRGERIARPRNRRAAEVERVAAGVEHHLDHVRVERLRRVVIGWQAVAIAASGCAASSSATARINAGASSGSSPWTLTTIASSGRPSCRAASARRSVPVAWSARVSRPRCRAPRRPS